MPSRCPRDIDTKAQRSGCLPPTYASIAGTILDAHCGTNAWKPCVASNSQQSLLLCIIQIGDHYSNLPVNQVDISISSGVIPGRDENDLNEWGLKFPINIPIEVGKRTYILIETEGYHDWEETFCPQKAERIDVEISLVPLLPTPNKQQET